MDNATLEHFDAVRTAAVDHATAVCAAAAPQSITRFGARGREACAEDIAFHLEFLRPVLESGHPAPFIAYLGWLTQVLETRGVPGDSLAISLEALSDFYARAMGEAGAPVFAALAAGREALRAGTDAVRATEAAGN